MLVNCIFRRLTLASLVLLPLLSGCGSPTAETNASSSGANSAGSVQAAGLGLVSNDAAKRSEAEILTLMDGEPQTIRQAANLAALSEALGEKASLRVLLDMKSLSKSEISGETPIDVPDDAETLGEALGAALSEIRADYYIYDGALVITSRGQADQQMQTRRYDLSGAEADVLQELRRTLPEQVPGAAWAMIDGEGGEYVVDEATSSLFVTQTFHYQDEIRRLLSEKLGEPVPFSFAKPEDIPERPVSGFGN